MDRPQGLISTNTRIRLSSGTNSGKSFLRYQPSTQCSMRVLERPAYKTNILLSCLSKEALQAVMSMGLTQAQMEDHEVVIH